MLTDFTAKRLAMDLVPWVDFIFGGLPGGLEMLDKTDFDFVGPERGVSKY